MKKIENILAVLNPNNTMSINRPLAHAIGMSEAVVYAALIAKYSYYEQTGKLTDDGWFFSTVTDLQESTTFGVKAQKSAIRNLTDRGLIKCEIRGMPAKRYFKICDDEVLLIKTLSEGVAICRSLSENGGKVKAAKAGDLSVGSSSETLKNAIPPNVENGVETMWNDVESIPCSRPSAGTSSYPQAVTSSRLAAGTSSLPQAVTSTRPSAVTSSCLGHIKSKDNKSKENNQEILNQSYLSSQDAREENFSESVENCEGLNERMTDSMDFSDILSEMGIDSEYNFGYVCESEKQLADFNEGERGVDVCTIPYYFHGDKRVMADALKYLTAYSYYWSANPDSQSAEFHELCITSLAEMVEGDSCQLSGQRVMYYTIIDKLNVLGRKQYLSSAFFEFESKWKQIKSENEIHSIKKYFKTCLWNWLENYEIEQMSLLMGEF